MTVLYIAISSSLSVTSYGCQNGTLVLGIYACRQAAYDALFTYVQKQQHFSDWYEFVSLEYALRSNESLPLDELQKGLGLSNEDPDHEDFWEELMQRYSLFFTVQRHEAGDLFPFYDWIWDLEGRDALRMLYDFLQRGLDGETYSEEMDECVRNYRLRQLANHAKNPPAANALQQSGLL